MAKLKIKQIEDLSLANGVITMGKTAEGGLNTIVPVTGVQEETNTGGYISGLSVEGNELVIARTALPAADIFDENKFKVTTSQTGGARTISILDSYVQGLFSVDPASGTGYISGLTYADGKFKPVYTTMPTIGAAKLFVKYGSADAVELFSANATDDNTLILTQVAKTGAAADVVVTANSELGLTSASVQAALEELQGDINALDAAQLTPGSGIAISDDHEISTTVTLNYDSENKKIQLLNKADGDVIGTVDAKAFLKDGMVSSATVVTNPEGQDAGTYIKLTFNTQDPVSQDKSHEDIFINVTSLIDIYTAGNDGINVDGRVISHKVGVVAANTQKGAVSENTITVPVVKVDGYGHVIALTEVEWTLPESTALESVSGSTSDYITVTVGEKDENKDQQITATAAIGSFETDGVNGLATTDDVKTYVDSKVANQTTEEITLTQIVRGTEFADNIELVVPAGYTILDGSTVGFLNGQLVPSVTVSGNEVTYVPYTDGDTVAYEEGDRFDVIATVTKTITVVKVEQA